MKTYGFNTTSDGTVIWVTSNSEEFICFTPYYGGWEKEKYVVDSGMDELAFAKKCLSGSTLEIVGSGEILNLQPGQYHPRIWRGIYKQSLLDGYDKLDPYETYGQVYMRSVVAAESLFAEVKELFRVVEPQQENFGCFGHRIRELLILLCTEIEACWSGVIKSNNLEQEANGRFSTKNFYSLCAPMKLSEWKVKLKDYGDFTYQPFLDWSLSQPSASIPWYEAYNKVKHDREGNFSLGTLNSVLEAAAALHIMQLAQFGPKVFDPWSGNRFSIYEVVEYPNFTLSEIYLSDPIDNGSFHTPLDIT